MSQQGVDEHDDPGHLERLLDDGSERRLQAAPGITHACQSTPLTPSACRSGRMASSWMLADSSTDSATKMAASPAQ